MVYAKLVKIEFVILLFYGLLYTYSETALLVSHDHRFSL